MHIKDIIIIGSGTSGSVLGYYLAKGGLNVLMLEAGREFTAETFPPNEMDYNSQMFWNGGMDLNSKATMAFLRAKCVGGGSVINQCLLDRFHDEVFKEWRDATSLDFLTGAEMKSHYDEIEKNIVLQEIPPEHRNKNAEIFIKGMEIMGRVWSPLRRGHVDCAIEKGNDCIACLGGCHRDSKQSMLVTFLPKAREHGLETMTEVTVKKIETSKEKIVVHAVKNGKSLQLEAKKCVIAGGSFGSTSLLLASGLKKQLPALGEGFYCHPQIMNFGVYDEPIDSHKGMFQSVKSSDPDLHAQGFKLENVFAPPIAIALLTPGYGKQHQEWMKKFRYLACIEVAVKDVGRGRIKLDKKGRLVVEKSLTKEDQKRARTGVEFVTDIFYKTGAKKVLVSPFMFGLHLMGGCSLGSDPATSVVNDDFQVHGFENIHVSDSSVFPRAPGVNPALTIMALSHRASERILANW